MVLYFLHRVSTVHLHRRHFTSWITSFFSQAKNKMEVTNKNFAEKLPVIEAAIDDAIFVAVDGEFTGLNCREDAISGIDTIQERYAKAHKSTTKFLLIQFGLCTFHYDPLSKIYFNKAFNFYIWPRPFSRAAPDPRFLCQASSLDFLSKQNFDFNKLIRDGISYLKSDDEKRLRDIFEERKELRRQSNHYSPSVIPVPNDHKKFLEVTVERVEAWMRPDAKSDPVLYLERCSPFHRKLIYQTLKGKFGPKLYMETVDRGRDKVIAITKVEADELQEREAERDRSELDELDSAVGFSKIIKKISNSKKLVVGHNMLLDLCFTLNQFVTHLPESYEDFKMLTQLTFPLVCDTKLMASTSPFREEIRNSSLEELLRTVSSDPYKIPEMVNRHDDGTAGYSLGEVNEKYHEAGYDAFITGLCFISMSNRLGKLSSKHKGDILPTSPIIAPFLNKLHLMNCSDIPYMNLVGKEIEPIRDDVFHITFPAEWTQSDIQNLFFTFGGVFVYWLSDTTAYVRLKEKVDNSSIVVTAALNTSSIYQIIPYAQHRQQFSESANTTGITPAVEKTSLSFGSSKTNHRSFSTSTARLPVVNPSGPTGVAKQLLKIDDSQNGSGSVKKRSASPDHDLRKRNKSVEDKSAGKTFEEPPWE